MFFILWLFISDIVKVSLQWKSLDLKVSMCQIFALETHFVHFNLSS